MTQKCSSCHCEERSDEAISTFLNSVEGVMLRMVCRLPNACHVERSRDIWFLTKLAFRSQPDPFGKLRAGSSARLRLGRDDKSSHEAFCNHRIRPIPPCKVLLHVGCDTSHHFNLLDSPRSAQRGLGLRPSAAWAKICLPTKLLTM